MCKKGKRRRRSAARARARSAAARASPRLSLPRYQKRRRRANRSKWHHQHVHANMCTWSFVRGGSGRRVTWASGLLVAKTRGARRRVAASRRLGRAARARAVWCANRRPPRSPPYPSPRYHARHATLPGAEAAHGARPWAQRRNGAGTRRGRLTALHSGLSARVGRRLGRRRRPPALPPAADLAARCPSLHPQYHIPAEECDFVWGVVVCVVMLICCGQGGYLLKEWTNKLSFSNK
jgi:hypothetical protein